MRKAGWTSWQGCCMPVCQCCCHKRMSRSRPTSAYRKSYASHPALLLSSATCFALHIGGVRGPGASPACPPPALAYASCSLLWLLSCSPGLQWHRHVLSSTSGQSRRSDKWWRSCHQSLQISTVIRSQQPSLQGDAADALDLCTVSL